MSRDISNQYMSKLIDSLHSDYDKWTMKERGGLSGGGSWMEYRSPAYTNSRGKKIVFVRSWGDHEFIGAFVNGSLLWEVSWVQRYNIFSSQTRRMWAGLRGVRKSCELSESLLIEEELRNSL